VDVVVPWLIAPVPQDSSYHRFADTTAWLGIPNFVNVATNELFILVGFMGLSASRTKGFALESAGMRLPYHVCFISVGLVGMGSAYYHVNPNNATLVWDRLPMTVSFMARVCPYHGGLRVSTGRKGLAVATNWNGCRVGWILVCD